MILGIVIGVGSTVAVLALGSLVGFGYVGMKSPNERIVKYYAVCTESDINKHNAELKNMDLDAKKKALIDLATDIEKRTDYAQDSTCSQIRLHAHLLGEDVDKVFSAVNDLDASARKSVLSDARLDYITGLDSARLHAEAFKNAHSKDLPVDPKAQG